MLNKGNTMQSRQTLLTPLLLLAGAMLTGCNSDAPSASEAQRSRKAFLVAVISSR
jgi:hypothetical protein